MPPDGGGYERGREEETAPSEGFWRDCRGKSLLVIRTRGPFSEGTKQLQHHLIQPYRIKHARRSILANPSVGLKGQLLTALALLDRRRE